MLHVISYCILFVLITKIPNADAGPGNPTCNISLELTKDGSKEIKVQGPTLAEGQLCTIAINHKEPQHRISLHFSNINFEQPTTGLKQGATEECKMAYVTFAENKDKLKESKKYCKTPDPATFLVDSSQLFIQYYAPKSVKKELTGFVADLKLVPPESKLCTQEILLTDDSGTSVIRTGNELDRDMECKVTVTSVDNAQNVVIAFENVEFQRTGDVCDTDYVKFAKDQTDLMKAEKYCSLPSFDKQVIDGSSLIISYHASTDRPRSTGFKATVRRMNAANMSKLSLLCNLLGIIPILTINH